jgi:hypothetical protein
MYNTMLNLSTNPTEINLARLKTDNILIKYLQLRNFVKVIEKNSKSSKQESHVHQVTLLALPIYK